ncbi:hypothetical protein EniLVp02_0162 [Vibrio phage EniLVp02]
MNIYDVKTPIVMVNAVTGEPGVVNDDPTAIVEMRSFLTEGKLSREEVLESIKSTATELEPKAEAAYLFSFETVNQFETGDATLIRAGFFVPETTEGNK